MNFKVLVAAPGLAIGLAVGLSGLAGASGLSALAADAPSPEAVVAHYADMAAVKYDDSLITAQRMRATIDSFLADPSAQTLIDARQSWRIARKPYQQSEVYRFGNSIVDEWEGRVNAWPLDEGLIDYVAPAYGVDNAGNAFYTANIIANPNLSLSGKTIDATVIDATLLRSLHEVDEVEANVATGYHAIEFLLWGQDLNGTSPGAGDRPWTDFSLDQCSNGNCDRRRAYLEAATDLLIDDLDEMVGNWQEGGAARTALADAPAAEGLTAILTGMGSLSYGELAGERMKLGLLLHDPEEEHDCFSDNSHNSHYFDTEGIRNVYLGRYTRMDGTVIEGPALADLVRAASPEADAVLRARLEATRVAMTAIVVPAETGQMSYDQMLGDNNPRGNALVEAAIEALVVQTGAIEQVVAALELDAIAFEGSDSLDAPEAVFN